MMATLIQLISVCADKLHLANLVDAYAELIRSRAFWNYVNAFDACTVFGGLVIVVLFVIHRMTRI